MDDEIESAPRPIPIVSALAVRIRTAVIRMQPGRRVAMVGVVALFVGAAAGFGVGRSLPEDTVPAGSLSAPTLGVPVERTSDFELAFGREPPALLTSADLASIGEAATREVDVLAGRSAVPPLCGTSIGQPASAAAISFPARSFEIGTATVEEIIWSRRTEAEAAGILLTLVTQAQRCPEVSSILDGGLAVTTTGVEPGIGAQHATFNLVGRADGPVQDVVVVVLVQLGADLIEIALSSSDGVDAPGLDRRVERIAEAAAARVLAG